MIQIISIILDHWHLNKKPDSPKLRGQTNFKILIFRWCFTKILPKNRKRQFCQMATRTGLEPTSFKLYSISEKFAITLIYLKEELEKFLMSLPNWISEFNLTCLWVKDQKSSVSIQIQLNINYQEWFMMNAFLQIMIRTNYLLGLEKELISLLQL